MSITHNIDFKKINIPKEYGKPISNIFFVIENNKSKTMENFSKLNQDTKDAIKVLISKMATNKDYKSPKIKYTLHGYDYGEIRPMPHRFFFFQKCGNNIIFFSYVLKKEDSLSDLFYKKLEKEKNKYAEEFEKYIARN